MGYDACRLLVSVNARRYLFLVLSSGTFGQLHYASLWSVWKVKDVEDMIAWRKI